MPNPADPNPIQASRTDLAKRLFADKIPPLWCPLLTHYGKDGAVDEERTLAHLDEVANFIDGILVPGTTGDGWQLSEAERLRVLGLVLDQATRLKLRILVGILKRDTASARACLVGTVEWLKARTGEPDIARCLHRRRIVGFTLCPPAGADRSQHQIQSELETLLDTGLPVALYNLPQFTGNRLEPDLVQHLANLYPNFLFFKDSSGLDDVARRLPPDAGVFLVRGAEGDYTQWLRRTGGCYDGLLLGSANVFARELHRLWRDLTRKRIAEAEKLSDRLTTVLREVFALATDVREGNAFANANKAIDHFMAFGPHAAQTPPPRIHGGHHLPLSLIRATGEALKRHGFLPEKGYLE